MEKKLVKALNTPHVSTRIVFRYCSIHSYEHETEIDEKIAVDFRAEKMKPEINFFSCLATKNEVKKG